MRTALERGFCRRSEAIAGVRIHPEGGRGAPWTLAHSLFGGFFCLTGSNWSLEHVDMCFFPEASWGDWSHDRRAFQRSAGAISGPSERSALDADGAGGIRGAAAERDKRLKGE